MTTNTAEESVLVYGPEDIDFDSPGVRHYRVAFHLDSSWGYSLVPLSVIVGSREPADRKPLRTVAAFGGTHGNEYESQVALSRLCRDTDPDRLAGRLLVVPQLSESACRAGTRVSPEDGMNMNRSFPGDPHGVLSRRIAHFATSQLLERADVILDLHSGGNEAVYPICTSFHPLANPDQHRETLIVAALFDTPYVFVYSSAMASGLLTDEGERAGKVTVGGEFGSGEAVGPAGVAHVYEGVKNVMRYYGMLDENPHVIDTARTSAQRVAAAPTLDDYRPCPHDGIWEPVLSPGADVGEGDLIGRLYEFGQHPSRIVEIRAHRAGILIAAFRGAQCPRGATLFVIADDVTADAAGELTHLIPERN